MLPVSLSSPGFLEVRSGTRDWQRFMWWVADRFFVDAKTEKWFDAVRMLAHRHPRVIRTVEYADHCDEVWGSRLPEAYPSFEEWRPMQTLLSNRPPFRPRD